MSASAQPADWGVRRDPFDRTLISRYKAILSKAPHDKLALSALLSLYKRHRTVDLLVREFEETLAKGETASTLVVLGRLARNAHDAGRALELYARATVLNDKDSAAWLAVAELRTARGDKDEARAAFAKASATATSKDQKQTALRQLIAATREARDSAAMETAFTELLALRPKDGRLWAERGDAQLETDAFDAALASYKKAEELLRGDPERRLLAIAARAHVFDKAGNPGDAIVEYERARSAAPPGFYLRKDLANRIIDVFRRHHSIRAALQYLDNEWPAKKRGGFEWGTIADLNKEIGETDQMVYALHQAVKAAPKDTTLQWKLIRHYDGVHETTVALSLLEAAATASPGDPSLNMELAQRLWLSETPVSDDDEFFGHVSLGRSRKRALAIAQRLARSAGRDVETHRALAEMFARWGRIDLATGEARTVASLEPGDDSWTLLGDALFASHKKSEAIEVWKKIGGSGKPVALQKLADIYLDHQLWNEAIDAYTEAMFGDFKNAMLWRGRAVALTELGRLSEARIDAQHAIKLQGNVEYDKGHEIRFRLVHIMRLEAIEDAMGDEAMEPDLWVMQLDTDFFGKKRDLEAGYLLAEYHRRKPDAKLARVLARLHEVAPTDHGAVSELIRLYRQLGKPDEALALAKWLANADPGRAKDLADVMLSIETERSAAAAKRAEREHDEEYFSGICDECRYTVPLVGGGRGGLPTKFGVRLGLGDTMRGTASSTLTLGARMLLPLHDELALVTRMDWVRRVEPPQLTMGTDTTVHAVGASVGLAYPLFRHEHGTGFVGAAYRGELRLGNEMERAGHDRIGFAADAMLEYVPQRVPASFGLRFEQGLSEGAASSTFLIEVTVEIDRR